MHAVKVIIIIVGKEIIEYGKFKPVITLQCFLNPATFSIISSSVLFFQKFTKSFYN